MGQDNSYGHPHEEVLSRFRDADTKLYRTDLQGDIVMTSDGKSLQVTTARNRNADTFGAVGNNSTVNRVHYILNTNNMKFHYPDCSAVDKMKQTNKKEQRTTREELLEQGYSPCGICKP